MQRFEKAVIVGVGLLGGSIGLALRQRNLAGQVVGAGRNQATLSRAAELGAVSSFSLDLEDACRDADLVVVCTPVQSIADYLIRCLASSLAHTCLVTDVGSTKAKICQSIPPSEHYRFCGSHPVAGSDRSGVEHASADLFVNRLAIVTPTEHTAEGLADRTEQFWQMLGCRTVCLSPVEHDQTVARVSHLPHLVAAALAAATDRNLLPLVGSGWTDTTRIAGGNIELWQQIVAENREPILAALKEFALSLTQWVRAIEREDSSLLLELLEAGKSKRDSVRSEDENHP
jgi:prephenate dehydrogenase